MADPRYLQLPPPLLPAIRTTIDDCARQACPQRHSVNHHAPFQLRSSMPSPPQPIEPPARTSSDTEETSRSNSHSSLVNWPSTGTSQDSAHRLSTYLPLPLSQAPTQQRQARADDTAEREAQAVAGLMSMNGGHGNPRRSPGPAHGRGSGTPYLTPPETGIGYGHLGNHAQQLQTSLPVSMPRGTKRTRELSPPPPVRGPATVRKPITTPEPDTAAEPASGKRRSCQICANDCQEVNVRATNSHFFGRNKTTTRKIPSDFFAWRCRKGYQRTKYEEDTRLGGSFRSQAQSVRDTAQKIDAWWSNVILMRRPLEWDIVMHASISKEGTLKTQDPINRELEKELIKHNLLGTRKSTAQVFEALDVLVARIIVLKEELAKQPEPGHLDPKPRDTYRQWIKASNLGKIEFLPVALDEAWVKEGKRWEPETGRREI